MKKILIIALFVAAPALPQIAKDQAAIKAVFAQIDGCITKGDSKCLSALFTDDATFAAVGQWQDQFHGGIVKFFEGIMPRNRREAGALGPEELRFSGDDRAFVDCSVKSIGPTTNEAPVRPSWHTAAVVKRDGAKWLLEDVRFYVVETGAATDARTEAHRRPGTPKATPVPTTAGSPERPQAPAEPEAPAQ